VGKLLVVLLAVVVAVEVIVVIGVAGALFWIGGRGTATVATSMLVVTAVAGVLALRGMRSGCEVPEISSRRALFRYVADSTAWESAVASMARDGCRKR
jgi:hypothetical protein